MYIILKKEKDDSKFVWYSFYMDVLEKKDLDTNDSGRCRVEKQGVCRLDKETDDLLIDWDKTDTYFLDRSYELSYVKWYIMKHKHLPVFPEKIVIATGG